jgi:hypothetical protein
MNKYICWCGDTFKTKKIAALHVKIRENSDEGWKHQILKQHWRSRFANWFFSLPGKKISHFIGAYLIYFVIIHHFHIDWNWWEATLIGVGMGFYIE